VNNLKNRNYGSQCPKRDPNLEPSIYISKALQGRYLFGT